MFSLYTSTLQRLGYSSSDIDSFLTTIKDNYLKKIYVIRPFLRGHTLLDISTGYGTFLFFLHSQFPELDLFSLDLDFSAISSFRSRCNFLTHFAVSHAFLLPFRHYSFDIVLSHNATHDLILDSYSEERFFVEFFSVLRPGGTFIIIDKVTDHTSINSFDYQMETLQHYLLKLAGKRVFGLKKFRDLERIISRFSDNYHSELLELSSHPLDSSFSKAFYGPSHWSYLLSLIRPPKRSLANDLVEDFIDKLNNDFFSFVPLPSAVFVGIKE